MILIYPSESVMHWQPEIAYSDWSVEFGNNTQTPSPPQKTNNLQVSEIVGRRGVYSCREHRKEGFTRIESEGSEPDKAAFLAAARLSTSSAGSQAYLLKQTYMNNAWESTEL